MSYRLPAHCPKNPTSIDNHPRTPNLDITKYTFQDILGLFHLSTSMDEDDLKRTKKKVLMTHPDKSGLPPDYFRFYAKAFEVVLVYYKESHSLEENAKRFEEGQHNQYAYVPSTSRDHALPPVVDVSQFNRDFNRVFDETVDNKKPAKKNEWFSREEPTVPTINGQVTQANIGQHFDTMKQHQKQNGLIRYGGVEEIQYNTGAKLYEEEEDEGDERTQNTYISSDPFGKLKFDDLRKVHKDQTIFGVSETEYQSKGTVKDYQNERSRQQYVYVPSDELEKRAQMEKMRLDQLRQKDLMRGLENERKQKEAMSHFLRLGR
jgi:hypothetical protein